MLLATLFGLVSTGLWADPPGGAESPEKSSLEFLPDDDIYPEYLASSFHPFTGFLGLVYIDTGIPEAHNLRPFVSFGGSFGFIGGSLGGRNGDQKRWVVDIDAGMRAQFDRKKSQDNIGWDGNFGFSYRIALNEAFALKTGVLHTSAHLGDEYMIRVGRERLGYTREEFLLGVAWAAMPGLTTYLEGGYAYRTGKADIVAQKPGRVEFGAQYTRTNVLFNGTVGWYAAADFYLMQERSWDVTSSVVAGFLIESHNRFYRFGAEFSSGRPPLGEFFDATETYVGIGVRVNLAGRGRF